MMASNAAYGTQQDMQMPMKVDCPIAPPPGLEQFGLQQPEATLDEYRVGEEVSVLRSHGSWSTCTIAAIDDNKVKVVLKDGTGMKIIRKEMMHTMKKVESPQPCLLNESLLNSHNAVLEAMMLENTLLRMQLQTCADPMVAEQHWWSPMDARMLSQAGCTPACTKKTKPSSKSKTQSQLQKKTDKVESDDDECFATSFETQATTSAGLSSYAASISIDDDFAEDEPNGAFAGKARHLPTTVVMQNIPNNMKRDMLLDLINAEGFKGSYDFVYLPLDFKGMVGLGYSFINFIDFEEAVRFQEHFSGFCSWSVKSNKVCEVTWSKSLQGKDAHIERYRNSPLMHESMADGCKPVVYKDGERIAFPEPTKRIRAPRQWPLRTAK